MFKRYLRHGGTTYFKQPFGCLLGRPVHMAPPDGDAGDDGDGGSGGKGKGDDKGGNEPTFTQKQLNDIVAKERKKVEAANAETVRQLKELQEKATMSEDQRTKLAAQIVELEQASMTAEEKAQAQLKQLQEERDQQLAQEKARADGNWNLFESSQKATAVTQAASKHGAYRTDQVTAIVMPQTKLVPVHGEDGKTIVSYRVVVPGVEVKDEATGKVEQKDVSVDQYVEGLKGSPDFANLFVSDKPGGTGYRPGSGGTGGADPKLLSAKQKIQLGLNQGR